MTFIVVIFESYFFLSTAFFVLVLRPPLFYIEKFAEIKLN